MKFEWKEYYKTMKRLIFILLILFTTVSGLAYYGTMSIASDFGSTLWGVLILLWLATGLFDFGEED